MKDPNPVYINYKVQGSYPSGSTISYLSRRFYIMGDDASEILVLNELLEEEERIQLRDSAFFLNPQNREVKRIDLTRFYDQLRSSFSQLNIEAATMIGEELVLGIRANTSYPDNFIVLASSDISSPEFIRMIPVKLPVEHAGISGMDYDQHRDILFITFSSESTSNDDMGSTKLFSIRF